MARAVAVLIVALIVLASAKRINHEQQFVSFGCCPEGYDLDMRTMKCQCPYDKPYANLGGYCVACNAPKYWDGALKECLSCQRFAHYDRTQRKCVCNASATEVDGKCLVLV